ncbi:MAG: hypothetical protein SFV15_00545 [Polyangiaceae bacterium]|nr:hypothetical protein [Polyangiaceae bacterium]
MSTKHGGFVSFAARATVWALMLASCSDVGSPVSSSDPAGSNTGGARSVVGVTNGARADAGATGITLSGAGAPGGTRNAGGTSGAGATSGGSGTAGVSGANGADCLPRVSADLVEYIRAAPYSKAGTTMQIWETQSSKWQAARSAALAWAKGDCSLFRASAVTMGYEAILLTDPKDLRSYWVLRDISSQFQGVFAFREPKEAATTRPLVIDSPHFGFDFQDDRAIRLFRDTGAVAFLQNSADRCSLPSCSGCSLVQNYSCEGECMRDSDVVHSVRNGYFAIYDGLEAARDDWHFEYHGASVSNNIRGCTGAAHISQASNVQLPAEEDDHTYPNRFWTALKKRVGDACACYHQRQEGCKLSGLTSTAGRRTNHDGKLLAEAELACTVMPSSLSKRFIHFEAYNVDPLHVTSALLEAVPLP